MSTSTSHVRPATAVVLLAAMADGVYVRLGSEEVGPIAAADSDALTAVNVAAAVNAHAGASALATASASGSVVTLTAVAPGCGGNGLPIDAEAVVSGAATTSAPCFSGGVSATFTF